MINRHFHIVINEIHSVKREINHKTITSKKKLCENFSIAEMNQNDVLKLGRSY